MENATNALLIAGGVLIGVIIISVAVYLFASTGNFATTVDDSTQANIIAAFNDDFEQYVGKNNISVYDIISVINLAEDYNSKAEEKIVDVVIDNISYIEKTNFDFSAKMKELETNNNTYTCVSVSYSSNTKKVNLIKFKQIKKI